MNKDASPRPGGASRALLVRKIEQLGPHTLGITWTDGHESRWRLADLRRACPCASCVDEWTGKPLLDPASVPDDLSATRVESVGRYALTIAFSDGHSTGIYTFPRLRALCQCEACTAAGEQPPG